MPIDLYAMKESPPCRAVLMVGKHLDIDLNVINVDLSKKQQFDEPLIRVILYYDGKNDS